VHELGLAASVLDIVREHVPERQAPLVRRVRVRIGELAGVQVDSLRFCFDAIVLDTPFRRADLAIEVVAAVRTCRSCGAETLGAKLLATCPRCGGSDATMTGGAELQVVDVELAEADGDQA
jgi:hydrogenase nickel incorporation protein HypA/HybF